MRTFAAVTAAAVVALTATAPLASDWSDRIDVWRIGILGGENESDRLKRYECFADKITENFNVPVELYPATDYAGVMQGLISDNLEAAGLGSSGYAGIYLQDPEAVIPLVTNKQIDGSLGYYSVMLVRADSGIEDLGRNEGPQPGLCRPQLNLGLSGPQFPAQ